MPLIRIPNRINFGAKVLCLKNGQIEWMKSRGEFSLTARLSGFVKVVAAASVWGFILIRVLFAVFFFLPQICSSGMIVYAMCPGKTAVIDSLFLTPYILTQIWPIDGLRYWCGVAKKKIFVDCSRLFAYTKYSSCPIHLFRFSYDKKMFVILYSDCHWTQIHHHLS